MTTADYQDALAACQTNLRATQDENVGLRRQIADLQARFDSVCEELRIAEEDLAFARAEAADYRNGDIGLREKLWEIYKLATAEHDPEDARHLMSVLGRIADLSNMPALKEHS